MLRCLRDHTLLKLVAGEGTAAQHSHLADCQHCHSRYQRITRHFQMIERTLLTTNPPLAVVHDRSRAPMWWVPAAVALACVLLVSWQGIWRSSVSSVNESSSASSVGQDEEVYTFLEDEAAPVLFASTETEHAAFSSADFFDDDNSTILPDDNSVIFTDEWPCDQNAPFSSPECELMVASSTLEEF